LASRHNSIKKIRADEKKRLINRRTISKLRSVARKFDEACKAKKVEDAKVISINLFSKYDKAVKRHVVKKNNANRSKSRIQKRLNLVKA